MDTFPIPKVLMVGISRNEAIFDGISTKKDIADDFPVDYEDNL